MRGDPKLWAIAGRFSALGLEMGLSLAIGFFMGRYADAKLGTKPYLTIAGFVFGIVAAFLAVYRVGRSVQKKLDQDAAKERAERGDPPAA
ncbi:MAG: AtpZ/AtpI family protein [Deltaproteobacteria bacterium]|nr:AtpZ/AtpI family protein [Deltaproteobacteria bacterium]